MSQRRKTSIQPPGEPHGWQPPIPTSSLCTGITARQLGQKSSAPRSIRGFILLLFSSSIPEKTGVTCPLPTAWPFPLAAKSQDPPLLPDSCPSIHAETGLLGLRVCSQHEGWPGWQMEDLINFRNGGFFPPQYLSPGSSPSLPPTILITNPYAAAPSPSFLQQSIQISN